MSESKPEYRIKRLGNNGKQPFFPINVDDNEKLLEFVAKYIKFPASQGACDIKLCINARREITRAEEVRIHK